MNLRRGSGWNEKTNDAEHGNVITIRNCMDVPDRRETYTNVLARVSTEVFSKWHRVLATLCPLSPMFPVLPTRCEWTLARACV